MLTDQDAMTARAVVPLLDQVYGPVASSPTALTTATTSIPGRGAPSRAAVSSAACELVAHEAASRPTQRDRHLRCIAERGRIGWQRASGYGWRALVEADISRWKRVIGDGLRSQTDGRQATEVAIAADVLNQMLELGRPEYVRIV